MAASGEGDGDLEKARESECAFEWDEDSKLYFHASSGFYHDPNAGWYYSSRDGLYYTFENGNYVLLTCEKLESEDHECTSISSTQPFEEKPCVTKQVTSGGTENQCQPSEWLEETLIDLYLSGYSNSEVTADSSSSLQKNDKLPYHHNDVVQQLEEGGWINEDVKEGDWINEDVKEGDWINEDVKEAHDSSDRLSVKDALWDEENWQAQYGQAVQLGDENLPSFPIVDLWDWKMVVETVKKRHKVVRVIGRLVRQSIKLHPSMPAGGGLLKTAAIRDVHLDLVRVASGKIYRLRSPNIRYLSSLSAYDSSNPTKDWGFPDLCLNFQSSPSTSFNQTREFNSSDAVTCEKSSVMFGGFPYIYDKHNNYRDRAAERRALHGNFSVGPGQKTFLNDSCYEAGSSSQSSDVEEGALEAMNLAFGRGSYARKILEKMGWKDGEALGSSTKGILEPLQAVGNKGYAGLGWNDIRRTT